MFEIDNIFQYPFEASSMGLQCSCLEDFGIPYDAICEKKKKKRCTVGRWLCRSGQGKSEGALELYLADVQIQASMGNFPRGAGILYERPTWLQSRRPKLLDHNRN